MNNGVDVVASRLPAGGSDRGDCAGAARLPAGGPGGLAGLPALLARPSRVGREPAAGPGIGYPGPGAASGRDRGLPKLGAQLLRPLPAAPPLPGTDPGLGRGP